MCNAKVLEIEKINAIGEEVDASYKFIIEGIRILKTKKSAILNNHVELQLFAGGFERLLKILLFLKEKHTLGKYPELERKTNFFKRFDNGHGITKMLDELIKYSSTVKLMNEIPMVVEDLEFLMNDNNFNIFIEILTDFSKHQRYYYIDVIAKKEYNIKNNFEKFKNLICTHSANIDVSTMTYDEEEDFILNSFIISVEKGVRAISRFFTHGLGNEGRKYYGNFADFFFMNDEDLGKCKYLLPKHNTQKDYQPWRENSLVFLKITTIAKSKTVNSSEYNDWAFTVNKVKVYNYKKGAFCFVKIGNRVFALNGNAGSRFKIPTYFASNYLKPRKYQVELLKIAQEL